MRQTLFDHSGQPIRVGQEIASGGEGIVYEVADDATAVLKLYRQTPLPPQAEKLIEIVRRSSRELEKVAAWPRATVHEGLGGPIVGITAMRVNEAREIHDLYSPAARRTRFPDATWRFLVHVAGNCARALATLHAAGVVVGDVNQKNVLVRKDGVVRFLDCDSYQIRSGQRVHYCAVGVPEFTPPELHGQKFQALERTTNHDNFGLAVLIFHLLFMGRHPFAGRFEGHGEMPLERAIREFRFAYAPNAAQVQMSPPPNVPTLMVVDPEIGRLFTRAFGRHSAQPGGRPSASEWALALERFGKQLTTCPVEPGHVYLKGTSSCPWCQLSKTSGVDFFVSATVQRLLAGHPPFDIAGAWKTIQRSRRPPEKFQMALVRSVTVTPEEIPEHLFEQSGNADLALMLCGISAGLTGLVVGMPESLLVTGPMTVVFGFVWILMRQGLPYGFELARREAVYGRCRQRVEELQSEGNSLTRGAAARFDAELAKLQTWHDDYRRLDSQKQADLQTLAAAAEARQRDEYLRRFRIDRARIEGIASGRTATLASYGIETAFDLNEMRIAGISGFGPGLIGNLMRWKQDLLQGFRFDARQGIPKSDQESLELKYAMLRQRIERDFKSAQRQLPQIVELCEQELAKLAAVASTANIEFAQAAVDLKLCRDRQPRSVPRSLPLAVAATLAASLLVGTALRMMTEGPVAVVNLSAESRV